MMMGHSSGPTNLGALSLPRFIEQDGFCPNTVNCRMVVPLDGKVVDLTVHISSAPGANEGWVFRLIDHGTGATAATCKIIGAGNNVCSDLNNAHVATAGDTFTVKIDICDAIGIAEIQDPSCTSTSPNPGAKMVATWTFVTP